MGNSTRDIGTEKRLFPTLRRCISLCVLSSNLKISMVVVSACIYHVLKFEVCISYRIFLAGLQKSVTYGNDKNKFSEWDFSCCWDYLVIYSNSANWMLNWKLRPWSFREITVFCLHLVSSMEKSGLHLVTYGTLKCDIRDKLMFLALQLRQQRLIVLVWLLCDITTYCRRRSRIYLL